MKTILRIIVILLVASVVSGAFWLVVNNTSAVSSSAGEGGRPSATTNADGTMPQRPVGMPEREGGEHGASLFGFVGVFSTLVKLSGITAIVLLVEKGISLFGKKRVASPA